MQKAFEKIIEKVKEYYDAVNPYVGNTVTKIVNQVAEEYKINDGWIPCSSGKMPVVPEGKEYVNVLITIRSHDFGKETITWHSSEYYKEDGFNTFYEVLAWRYDIEPYQPKGE